MTDVRLTALNPADSQVYPVACNDKGELLLEQTTGSDLDIAGNLTVQGETTFNGNITSLNEPYRIITTNVSDDVFIAQNVTTPTITFKGDGSATFAGSIQVGNLVTIYKQTTTGSDAVLSITSDVDGTEVEKFQVRASGYTSIQGNLVAGATNGSSGRAAALTNNDSRKGRPTIQVQNLGGGEAFGALSSDGNTFNVVINTNGSATFAGDVTVGSRGKQWMIVESGGVAHLVQQTKAANMPVADASDEIDPESGVEITDLSETVEEPFLTYPELRNIPQELDSHMALLQALRTEVQRVEEKLRMVPESGWEVWDGSDT